MTTPDSTVAVMRLHARAHPRFDAPTIDRVSLREALSTAWAFDAFFQACEADVSHRVSMSSIGRCSIRMTCFVVDIDHRIEGTKATPSLQWRSSIREKVRALREATKQKPVLYFTKSGARLLLRLPSPIPIDTEADARAWRARYGAWLEILRRDFDIEGDTACDDFARLFRLPFVHRAGVDVEDLRDSCPDRVIAYVPSEIGIWDPALNAEQLERIEGARSELMTVSRSRNDDRTVNIDPTTLDSLLARLCYGRGLVRGVASDGSKVFVRCPFGEHENGARSSTVIFRPRERGGLGGFKCAHASCFGRSAIDALNEFLPAEKRAAGSIAHRL
jgi:hypothetical protein